MSSALRALRRRSAPSRCATGAKAALAAPGRRTSAPLRHRRSQQCGSTDTQTRPWMKQLDIVLIVAQMRDCPFRRGIGGFCTLRGLTPTTAATPAGRRLRCHMARAGARRSASPQRLAFGQGNGGRGRNRVRHRVLRSASSSRDPSIRKSARRCRTATRCTCPGSRTSAA